MGPNQGSGKIWLADGLVHYRSADYGSWSFPAKDLIVFGEQTNDHGPGLDDWFVIFVTAGELGWYEASAYAEEIEEFREQLAGYLGVDDLNGELAFSTDYASNVIWPSSLRGQPLFTFTPVPKTGWRRLLPFGFERIRTELAHHVVDFVRRSQFAG